MIPGKLFRLFSITSILLGILPVITTTGCGRGTVPVQGKLVFSDNEQAVTGLNEWVITMESPEQKLSATGILQADGSFKVSTFEEGDGAMPGKYRVVITPPIASLTSDGPIPKPIIDPSYRRIKTTPLEVTIESGKNDLILKVNRAKP